VARDFLPIQIAPAHPSELSSTAFLAAARAFYERQFGGGTVLVEPAPGGILVAWTPPEADLDPLQYAVTLLERRQYVIAVPILQTLLREDPRNPVVLFNLGMAQSDLGKLDEALAHLQELTRQDANHAHGWVALGVAQTRAGRPDDAIETLRKAVVIAPDDPYARRNLGGLLGSKGLFDEALDHLREAVRLLPSDQQAIYGLAQALIKLGGDDHIAEADALLSKAIALEPDSEVAERCRSDRSRIAQNRFRSNAGAQVRMDAVMYCLGALQKFAQMSKEEVRAVAFEIAMLGTRGLDVNDPSQQYQLRSFPGRFSGLHLVAIEYVGFKIVDPNVDLGFDLSQEYRHAQLLAGANQEEQK
jgi:tetratricopeptide (TPR) repeat protein